MDSIIDHTEYKYTEVFKVKSIAWRRSGSGSDPWLEKKRKLFRLRARHIQINVVYLQVLTYYQPLINITL